ncbi:MAG: hypothetical protein ACR2LC_01660 [Pyrinomonadaceae bacterium]
MSFHFNENVALPGADTQRTLARGFPDADNKARSKVSREHSM